MEWEDLFKVFDEHIEPVPMLFGGGEIQFAKEGAKLENIEVSEEKSVIPEGALHKNKHEDFDLDVTKKGIPVITVDTMMWKLLKKFKNKKIL